MLLAPASDHEVMAGAVPNVADLFLPLKMARVSKRGYAARRRRGQVWHLTPRRTEFAQSIRDVDSDRRVSSFEKPGMSMASVTRREGSRVLQVASRVPGIT
jgi:hypothetical protein